MMLLWLACTAGPDDTKDGDRDEDGFTLAEDCDDLDPAVFPGAPEACNERDDDCDGEVDEAPADPRFADLDEDGHGDPDHPVASCTGLASADDCDDTDPSVFPGAPETCDGRDEDCDGGVDEEAVDPVAIYADGDGDAFGADPLPPACAAGAGESAQPGDCDDDDATAYPGAPEACDGADDNCNGEVDEHAGDAPTWYADADGDQYGDSAAPLRSCAPPAGYVADATDCAPADPSVHPGAPEQCDGVDNDCDTTTDVGATDAPTWYEDGDSDGWGGAAVEACEAPPGHVATGGDCDDADPEVSPDVVETPWDGVDNDCDGVELTCADTTSSALSLDVVASGDDAASTCEPAAEDAAVRWLAPEDGTWAFTGGMTLAARADDCSGAELACGEPVLELRAGEAVVLVAEGSGVVTVTRTGEAECTEGDDDGDGLHDCQDLECTADPACDVSLADGVLEATTGTVASGSTDSGGDDWASSCTALEDWDVAPDVAWAWVAPATATYTFTTHGSAYDTVLTLRDPAGAELGCNDNDDDTAWYFGLTSALSYDARAGELLLLVVDGYFGDYGDYVLTVE